jgi:hypothetical protein
MARTGERKERTILVKSIAAYELPCILNVAADAIGVAVNRWLRSLRKIT